MIARNVGSLLQLVRISRRFEFVRLAFVNVSQFGVGIHRLWYVITGNVSSFLHVGTVAGSLELFVDVGGSMLWIVVLGCSLLGVEHSCLDQTAFPRRFQEVFRIR